MWEVRHPRTGIGTSAKEGWALIAVVDGRQAGWSKGMTIDQWALFFLSHGATDALNLDGGASSAMFVASKGDIVNRMCKPRGNERKVANHIGILPAGSAAAAAGMLLPAAIARALFGGPRGFLAWGRS